MRRSRCRLNSNRRRTTFPRRKNRPPASPLPNESTAASLNAGQFASANRTRGRLRFSDRNFLHLDFDEAEDNRREDDSRDSHQSLADKEREQHEPHRVVNASADDSAIQEILELVN